MRDPDDGLEMRGWRVDFLCDTLLNEERCFFIQSRCGLIQQDDLCSIQSKRQSQQHPLRLTTTQMAPISLPEIRIHVPAVCDVRCACMDNGEGRGGRALAVGFGTGVGLGGEGEDGLEEGGRASREERGALGDIEDFGTVVWYTKLFGCSGTR